MGIFIKPQNKRRFGLFYDEVPVSRGYSLQLYFLKVWTIFEGAITRSSNTGERTYDVPCPTIIQTEGYRFLGVYLFSVRVDEVCGRTT